MSSWTKLPILVALLGTLPACGVLSPVSITSDSCSGFARINALDPVVRGEQLFDERFPIQTYQQARADGDDERALQVADIAVGNLNRPSDILTARTAGQVVAHNDFYAEACPEEE